MAIADFRWNDWRLLSIDDPANDEWIVESLNSSIANLRSATEPGEPDGVFAAIWILLLVSLH